jgi:hypothetical protein
MAYEVQAKTGPVLGQDGSLVDLRTTRDCALAVGDVHGRYYENASRGLTFVATTATAGIAPGTALTATPPLALVNPAGSGKNIEILKVIFAYVSGTLGAGSLWYCQGLNPTTLPLETAAAIRSCTLLSGVTTNANDVSKAYSGVSLTNTPVIIRSSAFSLDAYVGTVTTWNPPNIEEIASSIILTPGAFFAIEGIAGAGTSPLVSLAIEYAVVPQ